MQGHNLEVETLESLFKHRNIVVRIGKLPDLAGVGLIADQERDTLFGLRCRAGSREDEKVQNKRNLMRHMTDGSRVNYRKLIHHRGALKRLPRCLRTRQGSRVRISRTMGLGA
jgi:hypothetical protein